MKTLRPSGVVATARMLVRNGRMDMHLSAGSSGSDGSGTE